MCNYLPLGSIITLKEDEHNAYLMITTRAVSANSVGVKSMFDYGACVYPVGTISNNLYYFNEEDIEKVVFEGYRDKRDKEFLNETKNIIREQKYIKANPHEIISGLSGGEEND